MNVPHIGTVVRKHAVETSPMCKSEQHAICPPNGELAEIGEWQWPRLFHVRWFRMVSCTCMCHFERTER